ncbi:RNA-binding domain-containing protein [Gemmatimonadota bacterium Y43]|uniref:RNA-binding domain-containing protein n=1 Tax=Gaopeijia maritima TaxID=3119007 RepID=UPI00327EB678
MTEGTLVRRIQLGEDSALELKQVLLADQRVTAPRRDAFADEVAAFANAHGGTLVLGVDDVTRELVGIPLDRLDAVETWVREICNDSVVPAIDASIRKLELPDATGAPALVVVVEVERSLFVHRSPGGYFRRVGSSKREMSPDVLARLLQERSQTRVIRFDETAVPETTILDIVPALAGRFLMEGSQTSEENLSKLRILAADGDDVLRMSVAGVLLCTVDPTNWLPHAYIQAVAYAGERPDVNYQNDARDIGGPLDQQVFEALHFVRRNMRVAGLKQMGRLERPQVSERAVFEALVNAVAHRDYAMAGARIRLHLFRDRLELHVPGGLANTLTPDSLHLRQYSRNELVVSLLARCPIPEAVGIERGHLMDRRGDGVPIIVAETQRLTGRSPEYSVLDDSEVVLVIPAAGVADEPE